MNQATTVDTRLERDPRYSAAWNRYTELQLQLREAERQRQEIQQQMGNTGSDTRNAIRAEANALLSESAAAGIAKRDEVARSLGEVTHRIAVLREAVGLQKQVVEGLRAEVSLAICADLLPTHQAHVRAVALAAIGLADHVRTEWELRDRLAQNGVLGGHLRPMPLRGFNLTEPNSTISQFLLEAARYGFIEAAELPEHVRKWIPPAPQQVPAVKPAKRAAKEGWLNAA
ncbi:hypothetical protein RAMLITH_01680 [Ramlibacter sp. RBP-2]|uniref:Uncharacterized protein n=1 Tax=Ramlibacter lithotrophicus TaxID=2606681 RepID=A0A7X6DC93_9BURK|nr:hypothetical protein [Ramlibacter lithotrophicus]NKE64517.1 hypothetical protein [Ramlibacter lithotrophicus]